MKIDGIRVMGLTITIYVMLVLSVLVVRYEFPIFGSAETIGIETTEFLWTYRLIDLIAQAFVLFAAATCCVALLRIEEKE